MKYSIAIFIIVFPVFFAAAQQLKIDSLKLQLTLAKEDTNKVNALNTLSNFYAVSHADTSMLYAQQALDLVEKLNFEEGILLAEGTLAISLIFTGNSPLGLDHAFKTLSLAKKINPLMLGWAKFSENISCYSKMFLFISVIGSAKY